MTESSSSKTKKTARSVAKSISPRSLSKRKKLPKAEQLEVKIDPVEHCKVTREMVLEQRTKLADHIANYDDTKSTVRWQTSEILKYKVVRAWPIYAALAVEAAAIVWFGVRILG